MLNTWRGGWERLIGAVSKLLKLHEVFIYLCVVGVSKVSEELMVEKHCSKENK